MKKLMIFSFCSLLIGAVSCSKKSDDSITPAGTTTSTNATYKTSFSVTGAQYGNLNFNFAKDGSQIERYDGVIEKDSYGNTLTHVWITDLPSTAKTVDEYVSMVIYTEKPDKGSYSIDYYGKGVGNTAIALRLGKDTDLDAWACYKGSITITEVNKVGEPIAGTFEGDFFQAATQKTISIKNGAFTVQHKDNF